MKKNFDVAIIGGGVAGAFAALRGVQKYKKKKIALFELGRPPGKRRRPLEGWFGCFPTGDGKIYVDDIEKTYNLIDKRKTLAANKWFMSMIKEVGPSKITESKTPTANFLKKLNSHDFSIESHNYIQWEPESIHKLSRIVADQVVDSKNITPFFDTEVFSILKQEGMFVLTTTEGTFNAKKIIICVGRSGWRWVNELYKNFGLLIHDDYAYLGLRMECPISQMKELNKSHCTLKKDDLTIGPFSWFGTVIPEDHADLVISSFRSNESRWKSDKVSFNLIKKIYLPNEGCKQADRIGKLTFLLFNDRIGKAKTKILTKEDCPISMLPDYNWLPETINEAAKILPQIKTKTYFYAPTLIPMSSPIRIGSGLETELENMFVAGESSGIRGLAAAAITGAIAIDSACR